MAQQTAVSWYIEQLGKTDPRNLGEILTIHQQANKMFQQQITEAQMDMFYKNNNIPFGMHYLIKRDEALKYTEQYYTQTYGK